MWNRTTGSIASWLPGGGSACRRCSTAPVNRSWSSRSGPRQPPGAFPRSRLCNCGTSMPCLARNVLAGPSGVRIDSGSSSPKLGSTKATTAVRSSVVWRMITNALAPMRRASSLAAINIVRAVAQWQFAHDDRLPVTEARQLRRDSVDGNGRKSLPADGDADRPCWHRQRDVPQVLLIDPRCEHQCGKTANGRNSLDRHEYRSIRHAGGWRPIRSPNLAAVSHSPATNSRAAKTANMRAISRSNHSLNCDHWITSPVTLAQNSSGDRASRTRGAP